MANSFQIGDRVRYEPNTPNHLWPQLAGTEGTVIGGGVIGNWCQVQFGPGKHDYICPSPQMLVSQECGA